MRVQIVYPSKFLAKRRVKETRQEFSDKSSVNTSGFAGASFEISILNEIDFLQNYHKFR
jgi:hypothetical protein